MRSLTDASTLGRCNLRSRRRGHLTTSVRVSTARSADVLPEATTDKLVNVAADGEASKKSRSRTVADTVLLKGELEVCYRADFFGASVELDQLEQSQRACEFVVGFVGVVGVKLEQLE